MGGGERRGESGRQRNRQPASSRRTEGRERTKWPKRKYPASRHNPLDREPLRGRWRTVYPGHKVSRGGGSYESCNLLATAATGLRAGFSWVILAIQTALELHRVLRFGVATPLLSLALLPQSGSGCNEAAPGLCVFRSTAGTSHSMGPRSRSIVASHPE